MKTKVGMAVIATSFVAAAAPAAKAAVYEVHACRLPSGAAAPANGWSVTTGAIADLNCPGGTMTVRTPGGTIGQGWRYGIYFDAPPGTRITGFRRHVHGNVVQVPGGPPPWSWDYVESGMIVGQQSMADLAGEGNVGPFDVTYSFPVPRLSQLMLSVKCDENKDAGPCQGNGSYFSVSQIAVQLDDITAPRILSSSGSLLSGIGPLTGQRHLVLDLRDTGSGLYRVRVEVDGERMSELAIDDNDGACRRPFVVPVPCKLAAAVDVPIDTTKLTEGTHAVTVRVFDATGVNAAVVGPLNVLVDNLPEPPPRGTAACPATNGANITRTLKRRSVGFGGTASIVGRVTGPQASLKDAHVGIVDNPSLAAAPSLVKLGPRGHFRIKLRPRSSTTVRPVLVTSAGIAAACGKPAKIAVRAGVRLRAHPRNLRNGQSIRLRGRVSGVRRPPQGKTVAIQARARRASSWTTVTLIRTAADGRFAYAYRFRKTFRTTTYEFRAVAPREKGFPYLRGWSHTRRATVSP